MTVVYSAAEVPLSQYAASRNLSPARVKDAIRGLGNLVWPLNLPIPDDLLLPAFSRDHLDRVLGGSAAMDQVVSASGAGSQIALAVPAPRSALDLGNLGDLIDDNKALAIGSAVLGGTAIAAGVAAVRRSRSSRKKAKRRGKAVRTSRRRTRTSKRSRRSRHGGKRRKSRNRRGGAVKDRYKGRRVHLTKKGQPYILLASGKARFVKR